MTINTISKINMPENVTYIIRTLREHGYEAYIVGGCVRDSILGKQPQDWDITTSATPQQTKSLFRRTIDTGIEHGTVTIMLGAEGYEVTTYRVDGEYRDHRRPTGVTFTACLEEDLLRRDFTINAMAYNEAEGVIDKFHGIEDLEYGRIRCVGNATQRFDEDALRILRAVRFAAQLDFDIEESTQKAIQAQAKFLKDISAERIQMELTKLLISPHPEKLEQAYELGITQIVLPEFDAMMQTEQNNPYHCYSVGKHALVVAQNIAPTSILRWTAILHDVGKPKCKTTDAQGVDHFNGHPEQGAEMAKGILQRLKFDNDTIQRVTKLIRWHDYCISQVPSKPTLRKALNKMNPDIFPDYIAIRRADQQGQSDYHRKEKQEILQKTNSLYEQIMEEHNCLTMKELQMNGKHLQELGIQPGKEMGIILHDLLEKVLETPELNTTEQLQRIVLELHKEL